MAFGQSPFVQFHLRRFIIVVLLTLGFAVGFATVGNFADSYFDTAPLFLVISLIAAFVCLQLVLFRLMKVMVTQYNQK